MQSNPKRVTSSATKLSRPEKGSRKQTPDGRVFVCCDNVHHSTCGHNHKVKHGRVKEYWLGKSKLRKHSK